MNDEIDKVFASYHQVLDKEYFQVSEEDRDAIARLYLIREFISLDMTNGLVPKYKEFLNIKIKDCELIEDYEGADFNRRMLQQINYL